MRRVLSVIPFLCLLFALSACSSTPPSEPLTIGSQVDFAALEDQHGKAFSYQTVMQTLLFVDSMDAKDKVRDVLGSLRMSCLEEGRVVYLADISGMPLIISKLIAVPRLREYEYPIWLDYNGLATQQLPTHEDQVTYVQVYGGTIRAIEFIEDPKILLSRLLPQCGPAQQQMANGEE